MSYMYTNAHSHRCPLSIHLWFECLIMWALHTRATTCLHRTSVPAIISESSGERLGNSCRLTPWILQAWSLAPLPCHWDQPCPPGSLLLSSRLHPFQGMTKLLYVLLFREKTNTFPRPQDCTCLVGVESVLLLSQWYAGLQWKYAPSPLSKRYPAST